MLVKKNDKLIYYIILFHAQVQEVSRHIQTMSIEILPREIIANILTYTEKTSELLNFGITCKDFNYIIKEYKDIFNSVTIIRGGNKLKADIIGKIDLSIKSLNEISSIDIEKLKYIVNFYMYDYNLEDTENILDRLVNVKNVEINKCHYIYKIPEFINLIKIDMSNCINLTDISNLSKSTKLKYLILDACINLKDISVLENLNNLEYVSIKHCNLIEELKYLRKVKRINISGSGIKKIEGLGDELIELTIDEISNFIEDISELDKCINLETLNLCYCNNLRDISVVSKLHKLKKLDISGTYLLDYNVIDKCKNLEELIVSHNDYIYKLGDLEFKINKINLRGCENLEDISNLINVNELDLTLCESLSDISTLGKSKCLKKLSISRCEEIYDINGIEECQTLEYIDLSGCVYIKDISPLLKIKNLKYVNLKFCKYVKDTDIDLLKNLGIELYY